MEAANEQEQEALEAEKEEASEEVAEVNAEMESEGKWMKSVSLFVVKKCRQQCMSNLICFGFTFNWTKVAEEEEYEYEDAKIYDEEIMSMVRRLLLDCRRTKLSPW